ncbi:MAG: ABC transporter substrate-binding protein [Spirochaetaceae bacterium]|nr:MAG: ABC transporter substrate-binding protein [Spirochaetaceae bacterium]
MRKISFLAILMVFTATVFVSAVGVQESTFPAETRVITDANGTRHEVPVDIQRVVVINRQTAEALVLIGAETTVVATGDQTLRFNPYLPFADLPDVGRGSEVNIELLLTLEPDIVLTHTNRQPQLEGLLNPAGIPVFRIDNYQPASFDEELVLLASLFDQEVRAQEFLSWKNAIEAELAERIAQIPESEKPRVMALSAGFLNSQGGFRIFPSTRLDGSPGVGEGVSTLLAGGIDASDVRWDPAEASTTILVESEYVLDRNPEVLTLHGTWLGGYNEASVDRFYDVLDNVFENSPIRQLSAGENERVYVFHTDMLGANKRFIGLYQLARFLHPTRFADVDPLAFAEEYFERWLGIPLQGVWWAAASNR